LNEADFLALNAVYLKKLAAPEHVAHASGLALETARDVLAAAAGDGSLVDLGGQYMLTEDARARVLAYYSDTYASQREDANVVGWYDRFEGVNAHFIGAVTEWQKSGGDERVQERMLRLVERHVASLRELASSIPRYETYARRFEDGLARVDAGETDFVCKPTIDSIHNVWFEFHEDILAVIGRPRET
jgi:hypothetical protein